MGQPHDKPSTPANFLAQKHEFLDGFLGAARWSDGITRSAKLGIASTLLVGSFFLPPFSNWRQPISFVSAGESCVLGLLAAQQGSKWWLVIPCMIILGVCIGLYFAAYSF